MEILKRFLKLFKKPINKNHLKNPPKLRKDVTNLKIQDDVYFQVYWKELAIGKGPAVILYIYNKEVLKFDCFGKEKGHYHVDFYKQNGTKENRIFFTENRASKQIERTVFELNTNLDYYLQRSKDQCIRDIYIEKNNLEEALVPVKSKMIKVLETIPELSGI